MNSQVRNEPETPYVVGADHDSTMSVEDGIIDNAIGILRERMREPGAVIDSPDATRKFLALTMAELEHEEFHLICLDNRHRVIEVEAMFRGTIDGASVHPREVAKFALQVNAAAVVLAHNHPSGLAEPSRADITLTRRLVDALALIDVRVLDHIVIGSADSYVSFAERGLI